MASKPNPKWTREELEAGWKEERRLRKSAEAQVSEFYNLTARMTEALDNIENATRDARDALKRGLDEANWAGTPPRAQRQCKDGGSRG